VSKFYLRYFADEADQVRTVILPGDLQFLQSVERATVRTRFYTAVGHDGQPTDAAETAFGGIETVAAEAWRELSEGVWPLTPEAREHVAGWIALQLLRGSGNRASMSQLGTDIVQMELIVVAAEDFEMLSGISGNPTMKSRSAANGSVFLRIRSKSRHIQTITSNTSPICCRA
jgi:hypothetical protein